MGKIPVPIAKGNADFYNYKSFCGFAENRYRVSKWAAENTYQSRQEDKSINYEYFKF